MPLGQIIKSTGSWYAIRDLNNAVFEARLAGKLKLNDLKSTNPLAVGDWVNYFINEKDYIIDQIKPRKNFVARQSPRKKHDIHLIASNIDQACLIVTARMPDLKVGFIDRFLLMTEPRDIDTVIVVNKVDLLNDDELIHIYDIMGIYQKLGYSVIFTSVVQKTGLDQLEDILKDKISLLSGQSGVGKSSLINAIQPTLWLTTGEISDYTGKGMHTTTFAEMHPLDIGGDIIDTPGIKSLSFNNMNVSEVAHNFREFFDLLEHCRFGNCMHQNEPGCAVKLAIDKEEIAFSRYENYLQICQEIKDQKYWEIHD